MNLASDKIKSGTRSVFMGIVESWVGRVYFLSQSDIVHFYGTVTSVSGKKI